MYSIINVSIIYDLTVVIYFSPIPLLITQQNAFLKTFFLKNVLVLSTQNQIKRRKMEPHHQKVSGGRKNETEFSKLRSRKRSVMITMAAPWNFSLFFICVVKYPSFVSYLLNPVSIMTNGALLHTFLKEKQQR